MKRFVFLFALFFCAILDMNAQTTTRSFAYIYAFNAARGAAWGTDMALKEAQLLAPGGAKIKFDLDDKTITLKIPLPDKQDVLLIQKVEDSGDGTVQYECIHEKGKYDVLVLDVNGSRPEDRAVIIIMKMVGFILTDLTKDELLLLL